MHPAVKSVLEGRARRVLKHRWFAVPPNPLVTGLGVGAGAASRPRVGNGNQVRVAGGPKPKVVGQLKLFLVREFLLSRNGVKDSFVSFGSPGRRELREHVIELRRELALANPGVTVRRTFLQAVVAELVVPWAPNRALPKGKAKGWEAGTLEVTPGGATLSAVVVRSVFPFGRKGVKPMGKARAEAVAWVAVKLKEVGVQPQPVPNVGQGASVKPKPPKAKPNPLSLVGGSGNVVGGGVGGGGEGSSNGGNE